MESIGERIAGGDNAVCWGDGRLCKTEDGLKIQVSLTYSFKSQSEQIAAGLVCRT